MRILARVAVCVVSLVAVACSGNAARQAELRELEACKAMALGGLRRIPDSRSERFLGKVEEATAACRGGVNAVDGRETPWVDWTRYWGTGDALSLPTGYVSTEGPAFRGISGALMDLEYQRIELIKFNLFDNAGTFQDYLRGRDGVDGPALKAWPELRLPKTDPNYRRVGGDSAQVCSGELIRGRTLSGICNDIFNPRMGSTGTLFARNVPFEATYPDAGMDEITRNRHGSRLGLLTPDPQVISRTLLTRSQATGNMCNAGFGVPDNSADSDCDYQKAPFFNVLAAYWIQFMTHDWFSHMEEGHNGTAYIDMGCRTKLVNGVGVPLSEADVTAYGCRPGDRVDAALVADASTPQSFVVNGRTYLARAPKVFANSNTAWWDASQLYGYDERSQRRVKRDPADRSKLLLEPVTSAGGGGYLPVLRSDDPMAPQWAGQEAAAFPDNWTIGMSFYHNLFAREHNAFVTEFRRIATERPNDDSGLRNPARPSRVIAFKDVTADELFAAARLVVSATIAKIHTIEWTPQLLYGEPLYRGMNGNWNGLVGTSDPELTRILRQIVTHQFGDSPNAKAATQWYSVFASGPGIFGLGSTAPDWSLSNPQSLNAGVNHFGSPFNFPEEFITVYRLHSLLPDLIDYRDLRTNPNQITQKVPIISTFEYRATDAMRSRGLANWALSMGRQRLGLLTLHNIPQFMQNIQLPRLDGDGKQIDLAALDLIRDREHGVPRFNEFRRQYGLRQLTSFDDFFPKPLSGVHREWAQQLREVYGTHVCDASKVITNAQLNDDRSPINDCLGHRNGSEVDNIEDVDTVVGWLAESVRPHGFAISETQFVVFILNASRRLFSDRFFTSGFRPEFYSTLGVEWVNHNGPGPEQIEQGTPNGHRQPVSPLKRVLLRNVPELADELRNVVNMFDPWARARGDYYSLEWRPRPGAEADRAFAR